MFSPMGELDVRLRPRQVECYRRRAMCALHAFSWLKGRWVVVRTETHGKGLLSNAEPGMRNIDVCFTKLPEGALGADLTEVCYARSTTSPSFWRFISRDRRPFFTRLRLSHQEPGGRGKTQECQICQIYEGLLTGPT